jgi:predicted nucleotidyltransferase
LETIYLVRLVPPWSANVTTRAVATPKLIFVDSGLAVHLTPGVSEGSHGGLLENFVLSELPANRTLVIVTPAELRERLSMDPAAAALRLAGLHGSRARADATEGSDWDIGVLTDDSPDLPAPALSATLTEILGTDKVDVVDLRRETVGVIGDGSPSSVTSK